ncbi:thymidine kinase [Acetivibrio ethanolgignens]|uniref:Thymidine kinase n=1 Tax=Acetivibrio ethanolgignens TaxID=290052 RepID=A0A0V8QDQ3_9FIRM|nr:thymidine kinase [Acetivibrio ethanolgignens]KSV58679.1 thymidine kinase [Acetivibrio ethanolgignens]
MAKLYFRYGAMGSSKTANALMVEYNYYERGKRALLAKPKLESRDGEYIIKSRMGLSKECYFVEDLVQMSDEELKKWDCIIVDEAQFITKEQVRFMVHIVDDLEIPVICYGLRTDFRHELFEGSMWLLAWADSIEELKTVCWCGKGASCNARISDGKVVYAGEQVVLGGNESYMALCRKHYHEGNLGGESIKNAGQ